MRISEECIQPALSAYCNSRAVYWRTMVYSTHCDNYVVVFYVCSVLSDNSDVVCSQSTRNADCINCLGAFNDFITHDIDASYRPIHYIEASLLY